MNNIEIIETNISFISDNNDFIKIMDHQSRVISGANWNSYCDYYLNPENKTLRATFAGTLHRLAKITKLTYDDIHLSCIIDNGKFLTYRLAYIKGYCA